MVTPSHNERQLESNRTKILAKSFYRHLRTEGLSHDQIIELSATLLDLVHRDLTPPTAPERVSRRDQG